MRINAVRKSVLVVFSILILSTNQIYARDVDDNKIINIYERINPAIVSIEAELKEGVSGGTGCIITADGTILTSKHVINECTKIEVKTFDGKTYYAKIIPTKSKYNDLALLKIDAEKPLKTIKLGDSSSVKVGQKVLTIGNPFGFSGTLTQGIISRIDYTKDKIQTDAAINPGCSGGPVLDTTGEVIGISQSIYNPDNNISNIGIGFAIPSDTVKRFIAMNKQ